MADKAKVLVVANRTAGSPELLDALRHRAQEGEAEFTLLVPATPHGLAWAANTHAAEAEARGHLDELAERIRAAGVDLREAKVGDPDPLAAASDECNFTSYDEVIVSTLPLHLSKWLRVDLPRKVEAATKLPVTHVVAHEAPSPAGR
jgi:hypothetical protein